MTRVTCRRALNSNRKFRFIVIFLLRHQGWLDRACSWPRNARRFIMKARKISTVLVAIAVMLAAGAPRASAQTPNVVIQWNQMLQTLFPGTGPGLQLRSLPMMHIAMFDAINSIEEVYTPYLGQVKGSRGAAAEAAAATAARDVLAALYPAQVAMFDDLLATQLAGMPRGLAAQGEAIGRAVAAAVLER